MPYEKTDGQGFSLKNVQNIVVDQQFSGNRDNDGLTLIPPTLLEFANTFAKDLEETFEIQPTVKEGSEGGSNSIFITIGNSGDYRDVVGRETHEGYTLKTDESSIVITGASPLGAWWATRTVIQQAILSDDNSVPAGSGVDAPGWGTRGMMIDCARRHYPKEWLLDMCSYMSFFKQNTFHLHLSDNQIVDDYSSEVYKDIPAHFRLWSDSESVAGLNKYRNESYNREDFEEIQTKCAARGVAILPEIEAPGHALPIVQWKPELVYEDDHSLLNISHPDTIPTMQTIWREFLPWFQSKIVSIGADEYTGPAKDYKKFVNAMNEFIVKESDKQIRIWGTFPPSEETEEVEIPTDVLVQHWSWSFDDPIRDYINNDYHVINTDEMYYVVMKYGGYGRGIPLETIFSGNPDGGPWYPHIFDVKNASNNSPRDEPLIQGAITPIWNDHGVNSSTYLEAYQVWREGLPALADKHWGGELTREQFDSIFESLNKKVPNQDFERAIPSEGETIFEYDFSAVQGEAVKDKSPNGYDATTSCKVEGSALAFTPDCTLTTPWGSKGRDYTLTLKLKVDSVSDETNATLVKGRDSDLMITPNLTLFASGFHYRLDSGIPLGEEVTLEIIARGEQTFAVVTGADGKRGEEMEFVITATDVVAPMAIEAPIKEVGGWTGTLSGFKLTNTA